MKATLGATALCIIMAAAGATPAAAQDINIYMHGDRAATVEPGPHGMRGGPHMRGRGGHHRMDRDDDRRHGHHGRHHASGRGEGYGQHGEGHAMGHGMGHGKHHGKGDGWRGRHGRGMDRMLDMIELYDRDGDGKVTQAEIDAVRADRLAAFDADGNGMLSLDEYEALWLDAMRERMVDRFQSHDDDGDGQVTVEEFSERTSRIVLRRDRNADGAISLEDFRHGDGRPHRTPGGDDAE